MAVANVVSLKLADENPIFPFFVRFFVRSFGRGRRRRTRKKFAGLRPANFLLVIFFPARSSHPLGPRKTVRKRSQNGPKRSENGPKLFENGPKRSETGRIRRRIRWLSQLYCQPTLTKFRYSLSVTSTCSTNARRLPIFSHSLATSGCQ